MTIPILGVGPVSDPDRTARAITGKSDTAVNAPTAELRQGVITAVNVAGARVDVALGGDTTAIPSVAHLSNYRPTVNDTCWVLVNGPDLLVLDRTAALGPSVISTAAGSYVNVEEGRTSTSWGDLATYGPAVTVSVSPSGRLLVNAAVYMYAVSVQGGFMGIALSGATTYSPFDPFAVGGWVSSGSLIVNASKVILYTGLAPGQTTVTAKYRALQGGPGTVTFDFRYLWALPL